MKDVAYRVVADHLRTLVFAITDGAMPSNEGRGYVLRRILRRAVRYGRQYLDAHQPFLCELVPAVAECMAEAFPELNAAHGGRNVTHVADIIRDEESSFIKTLDRGISLFEDHVKDFTSAYELRDQLVRLLTNARPDLAHPGFDPNQVVVCADELAMITEHFRNLRDTPEWDPFDRLAADAHAVAWVVQGKSPIVGFSHGVQQLTNNVIPRAIAARFEISGYVAFQLHDTFGFPIDLTELMAEERGLTVNIGEYERLMEKARERARRSKTSHLISLIEEAIEADEPSTNFVGYDLLCAQNVRVIEVYNSDGGKTLDRESCDTGVIVLDETPFYAEAGGQVGDRGMIEGTNEEWCFDVETTKRIGTAWAHFGRCIKGVINPSFSGAGIGARSETDALPIAFSPIHVMSNAIVEESARTPTMQNHTATHVMNWALREVLGDHVQQKGSLVDPEKTRFDLSHHAQIGDDELTRIESIVNEKIAEDLPVHTNDNAPVPQKDAIKINGLRAVFGEKYPDEVRVVSIGAPVADLLADPGNDEWRNYSIEFCGGTHAKRTGEIERFRLIEESAVARGIRRVTGITAERARQAEEAARELACRLAEAAKCQDDSLVEKVAGLAADLAAKELPVVEKNRLRAQLAELQDLAKKRQKQQARAGAASVQAEADKLLESAERVGETAVICAALEGATVDQLRAASDSLRSRSGSAAVLLATHAEGKVVLLAAMTPDVVKRGIKAGDLIRQIAPIVGGKGGGRPDMAQGGGNDPSKIDAALAAAAVWAKERLG